MEHRSKLTRVETIVALEMLLCAREAKYLPTLAQDLGRSPDTLKTHRKHIYDKLGVHSQHELIQCVEAELSKSASVLFDPAGLEDVTERYLGALAKTLRNRLEEVSRRFTGLDLVREGARSALPLDDARRTEWLARIAWWGRTSNDLILNARLRLRDEFIEFGAAHLQPLQDRGLIRLDPHRVAGDVMDLVTSWTTQILGDPTQGGKALSAIDAYVDSLHTDQPSGGGRLPE